MYPVDLVYGDAHGTVNGLLTSIRQPGKYLLESRDDVVLDDSCNGIRTHTSRTLKVFVKEDPYSRQTLIPFKVFISSFVRDELWSSCEK